jgi:hypothetical protein
MKDFAVLIWKNKQTKPNKKFTKEASYNCYDVPISKDEVRIF